MWAVGGFAVLALVLIAGVVYFRRTPVELRAIRFKVSPPEKQDFPVLDNNPSFLSVSPDGTKLAFVTITEGHYKLWLRDLDSQTAQALPGTEEAWAPFWSPDSRSIAFTAGTSLKKVSISGGIVETITSLPGNGGGTWNQDGVILFVPSLNSAVLRVSSAGGSPTPVT